MKKRSFAIIALAVVMTLSGCSKISNLFGKKNDASKDASGIVETDEVSSAVTVGDAPETLDPAYASEADSTYVYHLFEGLYKYDLTGQVTYGIAESETVESGGKIWIFKLRTDTFWSDGEPVKAQDFVYAWRRAIAPDTASEYASLFLPIVNAASIIEGAADPSTLGVEALSDTELKVTFNSTMFKVSNIFIHQAFMPLREDKTGAAITEKVTALQSERDAKAASASSEAQEKTAEQLALEAEKTAEENKSARSAWSLDPKLCVTNGAYFIKSIDQDQLVLTANAGFHEATEIMQQELTFKFFGTAQDAYTAFAAGEVAFADQVSDSASTALYGIDGSPLRSISNFGVEFIALNNSALPFSVTAVRKAMLLCVRQTEISSALLDRFLPATGFIPSGISGEERGTSFRSSAGLILTASDSAYQENVSMARQLMTESGFEDGEGFPRTELLYDSSSALQQQVCETLATTWNSSLGISVIPKGVDSETLSDRVSSGDFDMAWSCVSSYIDDPMMLLKQFITGVTQNSSGMSDFTYDSYIDQAYNAFDYSEYMTCCKQADSEIVYNASIIPIAFETDLYLSNASARNVVVTSSGVKLFMYMYLQPPIEPAQSKKQAG